MFFRNFVRFTLLVATVFLAACLPRTATMPISQSALSSDFETRPVDPDDAGFNTHVFYRVMDRFGYAEVCGAIVTSSASALTGIERDVRQKYFITLNDDLMLNTLHAFSVVFPPDTPQTAQATCVATGVVWRPEYIGARPELVRRPG